MKSSLKIIIVTLVCSMIAGCGLNSYSQRPPADNLPKNEKVTSLANCSEFGDDWELFAADDSSLSFCYLSEWGEPTIEETSLDPKSRVGTVYYVKFKDNGPGISYSTLDYAKTGDHDTPELIDWQALDFNKSESELASIFFEGDKINTLKKLKIGGVPMLFAQIDLWQITGDYTSLMYYFVPNVQIDNRLFNLTVSGSPGQQNDLRSVLESMKGLSLSRGISNDVSDWSNYESQSLGISFSYPAEYVVDVFSQDRSVNRDSIKLYDQSTYRAKQNGQNVALAANIGFWVIDNPKKLSALDWAKQNTDHSNFKGKYKTLQIDSREAISYTWYGLGGGDRVLLVSDDRKSIYSFEVYFMDINEQIRNDFIDIVQTIKFLK